MSAIAPDRMAALQELQSRRDSLPPDKQAILDELTSRLSPKSPPQDLSTIRTLQAAQYPANATGKPAEAGILPRIAGGLGEGLDEGLSLFTHPQNTFDAFKRGVMAVGHPTGPMAIPQTSAISPLVQQAKSGDIAGAIARLGGQIAGGILTGKALSLASEAPGAALKSASEAMTDKINPDSEVLATRALKPGKTAPTFATGTDTAPSTASTALDEVKAYEDRTGAPVKTVTDLTKAMEDARNGEGGYNEQVSTLLDPRKDIVIPKSGQAIADAKIAAIPEGVRLTQPAKYEALVKEAMQTAGQDYTVDELNNIRQWGNAQGSTATGRNLKAQVILDENTAAMDKAATDTARGLLYDSVNGVSPQAGSAFKELSRRIGATMEVQDLAEGKTNRSIGQQLSPLAQKIEGMGKILSPIKTMRTAGSAAGSTIDSDIASMARKWTGRPEPVPGVPLQVAPTSRMITESTAVQLPAPDNSGVTVTNSPPSVPPAVARGRLLARGNPLPDPTELPSGGHELKITSTPSNPPPELVAGVNSGKIPQVLLQRGGGMPLMLESIEKDAMTGQPSRYIYRTTSGERVAFSAPQK